jgi:hypothetical protein
MKEEKNKSNYKYNIIDYVNAKSRSKLLIALKMSRSTFYDKAGKKLGQKGGFEIYEMKVIAIILNRPIHDLVTDIAFKHLLKNKF